MFLKVKRFNISFLFVYLNKGKPSEKFYRCFEARIFERCHHPFTSLHHLFKGILRPNNTGFYHFFFYMLVFLGKNPLISWSYNLFILSCYLFMLFILENLKFETHWILQNTSFFFCLVVGFWYIVDQARVALDMSIIR